MARAFILVLDSLGVGATPDAGAFGDADANTLGNIANWCADGNVGPDRPAPGILVIENMRRLGLGRCVEQASGKEIPGLAFGGRTTGIYGVCKEKSRGKDTPSGHWEMMGLPVDFDWGYFKPDYPSFPDELIEELCAKTGVNGILGNKAASGTEIIAELGEEHIKTGKPICYTSSDSVFQVAAHEEHFGLDNLMRFCEEAYELCKPYTIGRVIARPFLGSTPETFKRTGNRRDLSMPPHGKTLLDVAEDNGREVIGIGKIKDIFAGSGVTKSIKADGWSALFDATLEQARKAPDGSIVFTNFVDFDQEYGHRRNTAGYAVTLERFDLRLPELYMEMQRGDIAIITADHGCDPTAPGSDHTREHIPFVAFGPGITPRNIGVRESFADIGQSIAKYLGLPKVKHGSSAF